jgi:cytochrome c
MFKPPRGLAGALLVLAIVTGWMVPAPAYPDDAGAVGTAAPHQVAGPQAAARQIPGTSSLVMPAMDAERGRKLFASKGCVACHSVNGVGGHDATALDAHTMQPLMNPFEFAAKMWRMAPAMIYAQEEALGGQIQFTGQELADIIAFVHDDDVQHEFSEADIPPEIVPLMHHAHGERGGATEHGEEIRHHHGPDEMHHAD